jgi:DnaK suppressor protein
MNGLNSQFVENLQNHFLLEKERLLQVDPQAIQESEWDLEDSNDEADQAVVERVHGMFFRLKSREQLYLKKIDIALSKIENHTFGLCDDCDGSISKERLKARPTATRCIQCKEESERLEKTTIQGRTSKSLGKTFGQRAS